MLLLLSFKAFIHFFLNYYFICALFAYSRTGHDTLSSDMIKYNLNEKYTIKSDMIRYDTIQYDTQRYNTANQFIAV